MDVTFLSVLFVQFLTHIRYEEAKAKGVDNYDRDLEDVIDRLIVECDRKITRALKRLADEDAKAAIAISVSEVTQVMMKPFFESRTCSLLVSCYIGFIFNACCRQKRSWNCQR